jgi:peroxiredoxin Q/BCP
MWAMQTGDQVPDFEATDQHGTTHTLSSLLAEGPIVLFFYPKAMTPGCTAESCHFRDLKGDLAAIGARPVGISSDSVAKQKEFDDRHDLGFTLLSDQGGKIAKIFGTKRPLVAMARRHTFVIDTDRTVKAVIRSEMNMETHADKAIAALSA